MSRLSRARRRASGNYMDYIGAFLAGALWAVVLGAIVGAVIALIAGLITGGDISNGVVIAIVASVAGLFMLAMVALTVWELFYEKRPEDAD